MYLGSESVRDACETVICQSLSVESVVGIVEWALSEDDEGANSVNYVLHQVNKWIRTNFPALVSEMRDLEKKRASDAALVQLPFQVILSALQSDFTQGGEAIVLEAALAWIAARVKVFSTGGAAQEGTLPALVHYLSE